MVVAPFQGTGHIEASHPGNGISTQGIIPAGGAIGSYFYELANADEFILQRKGSGVGAWTETLQVGIRAHRDLHVANLEDALGSVRSTLPGLGAQVENRGEGEKDHDRDAEFEERPSRPVVARGEIRGTKFHG